MRCSTVSGKFKHSVPSEGSRLREVYDLFITNKGLPVSFNRTAGRDRSVLDNLTDFYGLDIRRIRNGIYVLAGEWFGRVYIDYIAERMEEV